MPWSVMTWEKLTKEAELTVTWPAHQERPNLARNLEQTRMSPWSKDTDSGKESNKCRTAFFFSFWKRTIKPKRICRHSSEKREVKLRSSVTNKKQNYQSGSNIRRESRYNYCKVEVSEKNSIKCQAERQTGKLEVKKHFWYHFPKEGNCFQVCRQRYQEVNKASATT